MRLQCLAAACIAGAFVAGAPAAYADLLVHVDKATQRMTVSVDGEPLYTWRVSTGRAGYNSPTGTFTPFRMDRKHFSREWDNAPMPYSIFFDKGNAIHGTYEARHLGRAASHGCVRLSVKHAAMLWGLVKHYGRANTQVVLSGKIPARKVVHARRQHRATVTRSLHARRHEAQRARERRAEARRRAEERRRAEARRRYRASAPTYYGPPRYRDRHDRPRYAEEAPPPRYFDRDSGPPPIFPFILFAPSGR